MVKASQLSQVTRKILVIAGAGASRNLGVGDSEMPLMTDWSDSLIDSLNKLEPGLATAMDLHKDVPGDEFEQRLGEFLHFGTVLFLFEKFAPLGMADVRAREAYPADWVRQARTRVGQVIHEIRANLYENFGFDRFDNALAELAYQGLRTVLAQNEVANSLWFATTNYDWAIETAFRTMKFQVLDGFEDSELGTTPKLDALGITDKALQSNGVVPVLHLHGAVGWYAQHDNNIRKIGGDMSLNETLGTPALLLPDNTKTSQSLPGAETIWNEFEQMLANCTHVMFLGHSLNDAHLVELVRGAEHPTAVVWPVENEEDRESKATRLEATFPGALLAAGTFGPRVQIDGQALNKWLTGRT